MAQNISGESFAVYFDDYDSGEVDAIDFLDVATTRHSVIRRDDGSAVATLLATWGDNILIRLQGSGSIAAGIVDAAWWNMTDAARAARAEYDIVPPIG